MALAAEKAGRGLKIQVPSLWGYTLKVVFALVVVLAILFIFAYILKKVRAGVSPFTRQKRIQVLELVPVVGNLGIAVVKVGRRLFLVGVSESNISLIAEIDEKDLQEETFDRVLEENL